MSKMTIEELLNSAFGSQMRKATEDEIINVLCGKCKEPPAGIVFMPSGEGLFVYDHEQTKEKKK